MFRGFATIAFCADDLGAAGDWDTELLGMPPYYAFPQPPAPAAYIEFRAGDEQGELGFIDRKNAPDGASNTAGGVVEFWHVDDLCATRTTWRSGPTGTPHERPYISTGRFCATNCRA